MKMYLAPVDGLVVRDPHRKYEQLPPFGSAVEKNRYWVRRLAEGSVVTTTATKIQEGKKAAAKALQNATKAQAKTPAKIGAKAS